LSKPKNIPEEKNLIVTTANEDLKEIYNTKMTGFLTQLPLGILSLNSKTSYKPEQISSDRR
jgi:hypothetical protein